jgi:hypothetical protein
MRPLRSLASLKRVFVAGTAFLGTALFVYSIHALGMPHIQEALVRIGWGFSAILLISGAREVARTLAWMRTIEGPVDLSFGDAFRARLAGEALSALLPMGILVGEPAKAEHVGHRLPFATAFSALVIELAFYGGSLVLLFSAGVVALRPSSAVLLLAAMGSIALARVRSRSRGTAIAESSGPADSRVANVIRRTVEKVRSLGDPVLGFAARHPGRVRRIVALEAAFQILAVVEVYLTLTLITPHHVAWTSAVVLETVSRAVTMMFKMLPMRMGVDEAGSALFADRLDLGAATGIMLALVRKLRLLFWSAVGLILLFTHSTGAHRFHRAFARQ